MEIVWAFLKTYWKHILIAALIGAVAFEHSRVTTRNEVISLQKVQIQQVRDANAGLSKAIDKQNASIDALHDTFVKQSGEMADLGKQLAKMNANTQTSIASILTQKQPQTCQEAIQFLIDKRTK